MVVPMIYPVEMERLEPYRLDGVARHLIDKQFVRSAERPDERDKVPPPFRRRNN